MSARPRVPRPGGTESSLGTGTVELQGGGLLGSDVVPPYRYVVTVEVSDFEQLGWGTAGEEMRGILYELHRFVEATQLVSERFSSSVAQQSVHMRKEV